MKEGITITTKNTTISASTVASTVTSATSQIQVFILEKEDQEIPRNVKHVVVQPTVQRIRKRAFYKCDQLESIQLPSTLIHISSAAFQYCSSLTSIILPPSIITIERDTFLGCTALQSIILPNNLTTIGKHAFYGCSSLSSITLPSSSSTLTTLEQFAFYRCASLISITIPSSVSYIGESTFSGCFSLTSIHFSPNSSLERIHKATFAGCYSLTSIDIPSSVTTIDQHAFHSCPSLICIHLSSHIKKGKEDDMPFDDCYSLQKVMKRRQKNIAALLGSQTNSNDGTDTLSFPNKNDDKNVDIFELLKIRFQDKKLHQLCHSTDITMDQLQSHLTHHPLSSQEKDVFDMTPLHTLLCNPYSTVEMMNLLIDTYPNALQQKNVVGMTPLQLACLNANAASNGVLSTLVDRIYEFGCVETLMGMMELKDVFERPTIWLTNLFEMMRNKPEILSIMMLPLPAQYTTSSSSLLAYEYGNNAGLLSGDMRIDAEVTVMSQQHYRDFVAKEKQVCPDSTVDCTHRGNDSDCTHINSTKLVMKKEDSLTACSSGGEMDKRSIGIFLKRLISGRRGRRQLRRVSAIVAS